MTAFEWLRLRFGPDRDRGSVTVFLAITMVGLLVLLGLVADGGAKLRATERAAATAAEAARAGGQALDLPAATAGEPIHVDRSAAANAARDYLTATGATGTVTVSDDRTQLTVTVTSTAPTVFLSLIGIQNLASTATAHAVLVAGITGGGT